MTEPASTPAGARRSLIVATSLLALAVVFAYSVVLLFDAYKIPSLAMAPTLNPDDRVLVRVDGGSKVARGDIVVFRSPDGGPASRISRVAGVGGDRLETLEGRLVRNGKPVDEPFLMDGARTDHLDNVLVPDGSVFLMGDNREDSADSRVFGPVVADEVVGHVAFTNIPLDWIGLGLIALTALNLVRVVLKRRRAKGPSPSPAEAS